MKKKQTFTDFQQKREYKLWDRLREMQRNLELSSDGFYTSKDNGGVYWEPFLILLYKFGNILKQTGKLKEIKMDWMRPLNYFESQTDGKITYDGRTYVVDKHGTTNANNLRTAFRSVLAGVEAFDELSDANFQNKYRTLHTELGIFFKYLSVFVKDGYRLMHENIKEILKSLRLLRKPAYQLFSLEKNEEKMEDLTVFQSQKAMKVFTRNVHGFLQGEEYRLKRDCDIDKFDDFLGQCLSQNFYEVHYTNRKREEEKSNQIVTKTSEKNLPVLPKLKEEFQKKLRDAEELHKLSYPNILNLTQRKPTRIHKEAIQLKLEEGFDAMFKYLQLKRFDEFPFDIEAHKIFVNLNKIPNGHSIEQTNYYLKQLVAFIEELKQMCYDMKINGLSRVLIPITANEAFVAVLKRIYDIHNIIDRVIGDKLLYDQYLFFFSSIQLIVNSTMKEHIEVIKKPKFIEESIPKYLLFESMRKSVEVMRRMMQNSRFKEKHFNRDDYHQTNQHIIDGENNIVLNSYELSDQMRRSLSTEIKEAMKTYEGELTNYGRFWLMEGYFPPEDRQLWFDAIDMLNNINDLVQDDIRDTILTEYKEEEVVINDSNSNTELEKTRMSDKKMPKVNKRSNSKGGKGSKGPKRPLVQVSIPKNSGFEKKKITLRKTAEKEELDSKKKLPIIFNNLRPPFVWNFPLQRLIKNQNEELVREGNGPMKTEIRKVNIGKCYRDRRIERFNELFEIIFKHSMEYTLTKKGNQWQYVLDKIFCVLKIDYTFLLIKPQGEKDNNGENTDEYTSNN